jgi:hypothetical protein
VSALTDYLLSRPGLVGLWPADDAAASTTLNDIGPNNLDGIEMNAGVSRNAFGAAGFVTGHATSWASSGTEARGFQVATAGNVLLQLQTLTYGVFGRLTAANNGPIHLGRQNGVNFSTGSALKLNVSMTGGGPTAPARTNPTTISLNTSHLFGVTYDGEVMQPWLDGAREGSYQRVAGPFTSFLNRVVFGGDMGQLGAGHLLSVAFAFNRPLTMGEWATIHQLGIGNATADQIAQFDYLADSIPQVAASAEAHRCMSCGGRRRALEGGIKRTNPTRESHLACFGAQAEWRETPMGAPLATNTDRELDAYAARLADSVMDVYSKRPTTDSPWYIASTGQIVPQNTQVYGAVIATLGELHRYAGGGPRSPHLQRMKLVMGYLRANQIVEGETRAGWFSTNGLFSGEFGGNGVFVFYDLLPGVLAVWRDLDSTTRSTWLDTLRRAGESEWAWEPANFWANGNIVTYQWGIYRMMAELDPAWASTWLARADAYIALMLNPTGTSSYVSGILTGVGMRQYVDGNPANDTRITAIATLRALSDLTGKAYLTEGTSATATGPGNTFNTTYGRDWRYTFVQAQLALGVYLMTGDTDALKMAHVFTNTVHPRHNLTGSSVTGPSGSSVQGWWSDYRGGVRVNVEEIGHIYHLHNMRRLGREDLLTAQQQADHHVFLEANAVLNTTQQNVWYRNAADLTRYLSMSPHAPA